MVMSRKGGETSSLDSTSTLTEMNMGISNYRSSKVDLEGGDRNRTVVTRTQDIRGEMTATEGSVNVGGQDTEAATNVERHVEEGSPEQKVEADKGEPDIFDRFSPARKRAILAIVSYSAFISRKPLIRPFTSSTTKPD